MLNFDPPLYSFRKNKKYDLCVICFIIRSRVHYISPKKENLAARFNKNLTKRYIFRKRIFYFFSNYILYDRTIPVP